MALLFVSSILLSFTRLNASGSITCITNQDCTVDCSKTDCTSYTINATTASSLNISCRSFSSSFKKCDYMTIYCPKTTSSSCSINCNDYQCQHTVIHYPQPQNISINCYGTQSCQYMRLLGPISPISTSSQVNKTATIYCYTAPTPHTSDYGHCGYASFDVNYITDVSIVCNSPGQRLGLVSTKQEHAACYQAKFFTQHSVNVKMSCGYNDCSGTRIYAQSVSNELSVGCYGEYGCQGTHVFANYTNYLSLSCSNNNRACHAVKVYANSYKQNALDITCSYTHDEYGCSVDIYGADNYVSNWMYFNKYTYSDIPNSISVHCGSKGSTTLTWDSTVQSYTCSATNTQCCPWKYGSIPTIPAQNITCRDNQNCMVDCLNNDCAAYSIIATTASSLSITCSSSTVFPGRCVQMQVFCPNKTTATCRIDCNHRQCQNTTINYPQTQNIYINCYGTASCLGLQLIGPINDDQSAVIQHNATILCSSYNDYYGPCMHATFDVHYVANTQIKCGYEKTKFWRYDPDKDIAACYKTTFNVKFASNVNMLCGFKDCDLTQIYADYVANEFKLECDNVHSCDYVSIYAYYANYMNLNCSNDACNYMTIYANSYKSSALDVICNSLDNDLGCIMDIYASDDYVLDWMRFNRGIYNQRVKNRIIFHCNLRGTQRIEYNLTTQSYICVNKPMCCPWKYGDIVCNNDDSHCIIDCRKETGGCNGKVIDAVNASSLTVICKKDKGICSNSTILGPRKVAAYGVDNTTLNIKCLAANSCKWSIVYGYTNSLHACDNMEVYTFNNTAIINCLKYNSCYKLNIYANYTNNLAINCMENRACRYVNVYADNAHNVNVICSGYFMTSSSYPMTKAACEYIDVYAANVDYVNFNCYGSYICYHTNIYANNAGIIDTIAYGDHALCFGSIYASNANELHLSCYANANFTEFETAETACYHSYIYLPKKTVLNCYGKGCYSLYLDTSKVYGEFDNFTVNMNGCWACYDIATCIDYWYIQCPGGSRYNNTFYGNSCQYETYCNCNALYTKIWFSNDVLCEYPLITAPTHLPTFNPITHKATSTNPSISPTYSPVFISFTPTIIPISIHDLFTMSPSITGDAQTVSTITGDASFTTMTKDKTTNGYNKSDKSQTLMNVIIGLVVVIVLVCCGVMIGVMIGVIYCRKRKKNKMEHVRLEESVVGHIEQESVEFTETATKKAENNKYSELIDALTTDK